MPQMWGGRSGAALGLREPGSAIEYKAWVCTNRACLFNVKIRNGDIIINEPVNDGSMHAYRGAR